MYVRGDIRRWDEWDDELCGWEYEICLDVTRYKSRIYIKVVRAGNEDECRGVKDLV